MKKQYIIYLILLIISVNTAYSQRILITNDTLRNRFKKESANEVLDYFLENTNWSLDNKGIYYDKILKDSLLKWLDEDVIINRKLSERRKYMISYFDDDELKSLTKNYVSHDLKLNFDSIYLDSDLYVQYYKQAISASLDNYKKLSLGKFEKLLPPYLVLNFHSQIVYPEAYKRIKHWWYLYNKDEQSLYSSLLKMNDPEAQSVYDRRLKEFIKSKDQTYPYYLAMPSLETIANAYAVRKLLELLPVTRAVQIISGEPPIPHDEIVLFSLMMLCTRYKIPLPEIKKNEKSITEYINVYRNNIIEAANRLIEKLEKEEQYWMENMPFDYIPDLSKE